MKILVAGGAGYIGSHTVVQLIEAGYDVVIADNFVNSSRRVIARLEALTGMVLPLYELDLSDAFAVAQMFEEERFDAVVHFAGLKAVGESVAEPLRYYEKNLLTTIVLVREMIRNEVKQMIFSSSATVYGSQQVAATEDQDTFATNPYGWTKVMQEQILQDASASDASLRFGILRYFNPVGAHKSGFLGEDPRGVPNNLVPYVAQVASGKRDRLRVFGGDYETRDGTGVRDFIHVEDLAAGHIAALRHLDQAAAGVHTWNLGTGQGVSVLELVHAFEAASGRSVPITIVDRRVGDVAVSYADPSKANRELGWEAKRSLLEMCRDVWHWQSLNPTGYGD